MMISYSRASNDVVMTCALLERLIEDAWLGELVDPLLAIELGIEGITHFVGNHEWKT